MSKPAEGYAVAVTMEFLLPDLETKHGELKWTTYGYTNEQADLFGGAMVDRLNQFALELIEGKKSGDWTTVMKSPVKGKPA